MLAKIVFRHRPASEGTDMLRASTVAVSILTPSVEPVVSWIGLLYGPISRLNSEDCPRYSRSCCPSYEE